MRGTYRCSSRLGAVRLPDQISVRQPVSTRLHAIALPSRARKIAGYGFPELQGPNPVPSRAMPDIEPFFPWDLDCYAPTA